MLNYVTQPHAFEPSDLNFLQQFFETTCSSRGIDSRSKVASDLAACIIEAYQRGARSEKELIYQLREFAEAS